VNSVKKNNYRIFVMKQLYPFFDGVKKWFACNVCISVTLKIFALLVPVFYALFVEKVLLAKSAKYLVVVVLGTLLLQVLISVFNMCKIKCTYKVNNTVFKQVKIKALQQYFDMKFEKYPSVKAGDVKMVLEDDVNRLSAFGGAQSIDYVLNCVYAVILIILLFGLDWRLSLLSFMFIPITFALDHLVGDKEKGVNGALNANDGSWATWLDESIKGWKEIRINKLATKREEEFEKFQKTEEKNFLVWIRYWVTRVLVIPKIKDDFVMQFILYFLGGILIYYNYLSIGVLLVFVQYYGMLSNTVKDLSQADANLQSDMYFYERILERLTNEEDKAEDGKSEIDRYDISFSNVSVRYPGMDTEVVENLSFSIKEGERVIIRGASGAGKSTVLKLLMGVLSPDKGSVSYGDINLSNINKKKLYKNLAYISQDAMLFNDTVMENLILGNGTASMEEIKEACKKACIQDVIESLPEGYNTIIGENGSMLSGGQRQRLLLARAFLRDAMIYVFDEATSALDKKIENEIEKALEQIPSERTVIVVTHREKFFDDYSIVNKISISANTKPK